MRIHRVEAFQVTYTFAAIVSFCVSAIAATLALCSL